MGDLFGSKKYIILLNITVVGVPGGGRHNKCG